MNMDSNQPPPTILGPDGAPAGGIRIPFRPAGRLSHRETQRRLDITVEENHKLAMFAQQCLTRMEDVRCHLQAHLECLGRKPWHRETRQVLQDCLSQLPKPKPPQKDVQQGGPGPAPGPQSFGM